MHATREPGRTARESLSDRARSLVCVLANMRVLALQSPHVTASYRRLRIAVVLFVVTHALGMLSMLWLVLPGLSPHLTVDARIRYIAEQPTLWRLGWLPWQLSALADVLLTAALLHWAHATRARRAWAWLVASTPFLLIALVPDQYAEARLISDFMRVREPSAWIEQLRMHAWLSGTLAVLGYTLMTLCWVRASHAFSPEPQVHWVKWLEASVIIAFVGAAAANHVAWHANAGDERAFDVTVALNAYAFPGLLLIAVAIAKRAARLRNRLRSLGAKPAR